MVGWLCPSRHGPKDVHACQRLSGRLNPIRLEIRVCIAWPWLADDEALQDVPLLCSCISNVIMYALPIRRHLIRQFSLIAGKGG